MNIVDFEYISDDIPEPSAHFVYQRMFPAPDEVEADIIDGVKAKIKDYPFMMGIQVRRNPGENYTTWWCGAVLIDEGYALTAAHCLEDR